MEKQKKENDYIGIIDEGYSWMMEASILFNLIVFNVEIIKNQHL